MEDNVPPFFFGTNKNQIIYFFLAFKLYSHSKLSINYLF